MDTSYFWQVVILLAIGTFLIRASFLFLSNRIRISSRLKEIFTYIPAAIIPAFIGPMVFLHKGQISALMGKERMLVLILATILCYFTKSMLATVVFGLSFLFLILP